MNDYKFDALSTRSFEQLVQSIALAELTPGLTPFGDGPDGGREATFNGPTEYFTTGDRWNGYGVIQAKFLQRPQNTSADGEWALRQLKSELSAYAENKRKRKRNIPEYYLYVTNATLSSAQDSGFKDKAHALLAEFASTNSVSGTDIWDYDKLRVLLDKHTGIRTAYDAWLTPGDVLAAVIARLENQEPNFHKIVTKLMARDLLNDQYARLEQAGHSSDIRVPLANVFVDIPFDARPERERGGQDDEGRPVVKEILASAESKLDPETLRSDGPESHLAESRYVLIGGPGQGKTTVGQFMCQLFRAALLKSIPGHLLEYEVKSALRNFERQLSSEDLQVPTARRFPVHIVLNELAHFLVDAAPEQASISAFLARRMSIRLKSEVREEDIVRWVKAYPWFVVFDGLDEVPASTNREEVLRAIREFLSDARAENADMLVLATSRPQGYSDEFNPRVYRHLRLAPLNNDHSMRYGRRLIDARHGVNSDRGAAVLAKLERAAKQESVSHLMRSPLQVTIMALLVDRVGQPPQERYSLFQDYYQVIYSRELERDIPAASILRDHRADIDSIHWRVGLALQARSEVRGGTEARLTRSEFSMIVRDRLSSEGHDGDKLERLTDSMTDAAAQRLVFIVGHENDAIGFEIRSLQEFMAAEALHEGGELLLQERLRKIAHAVHWRNVFLFAAGRCFTKNQALRDTIVLICHELNGTAPSDPVSSRLMHGSELALDLLEDGSCREQPKYIRHLMAMACDLIAEPAADHCQRLVAAAYDLNSINDLHEELRLPTRASLPGFIPSLMALVARGDEFSISTIKDLQSAGILASRQLLREAVVAGAASFIRPQLADLLLDIDPGDRIIGMRVTEEISRQLASGKPEWVATALRFLGMHRVLLGTSRTSLLMDEGSLSGWTLHYRSMAKSFVQRFAEIPIEGKPWAAPIAIGRFAHEPSVDHLVNALDSCIHSTISMAELIALSPWPLAGLLHAIQNGEANLMNRVRNGEFGDGNAWGSAEERWERDGVRDIDLEYSVGLVSAAGFDSNVATIGFPMVSGTGMRRSSSVAASTHIVGRLAEISYIRPDSPTAIALARIVLRSLVALPDEGIEVSDLAPVFFEVISRHRDALSGAVPIGAVRAFLQYLTSDERAVVYDSYRSPFAYSIGGGKATPEMVLDVIASLRANPEMIGHCAVLVTMAMAHDIRKYLQPTVAIKPTPEDAKDMRQVLALFDLVQSGPSAAFEDLRTALESSRWPEDLADQVEDIMIRQGVSLDLRETFLLKLGNSLHNDISGAVVPALKRIARQRRSGIEDEGNCVTLGLPPVISRLATGLSDDLPPVRFERQSSRNH